MQREKGKATIAIVIMIVAFVGVWIAGHYGGVLTFKFPSKALFFLSLTAAVWVVEAILSYLFDGSFAFQDHGFDLTVLGSTQLIALALGGITGDPFPGQAWWITLGTIPLASIQIAWKYSWLKRGLQHGPVAFRAFCYAGGIFSVEAFIVVSLNDKVVVPWIV